MNLSSNLGKMFRAQCSLTVVLFLLIKHKKLTSFIMTPIKLQIYISSSVMGLGYNTFLLHPRPVTLTKRYLQFYRCHDKTSKVIYICF